MISTIGVSKNTKEFLDGFNEMKKRISPSLIIVRGKYIEGMTGNFIFVDFDESFNIKKKYENLKLFNLSRIIEIKESY